MSNSNTKHWAFTWDTNVAQKKLPEISNLIIFLDRIADSAVFQEEKGIIAGKTHYQGNFSLIGSRKSKKDVLELFQTRFKNVSGLSLSKIYDKKAISVYNTKEETRVSGPYYCGSQEFYDLSYCDMHLKPWQHDLFELLKSVKNDTHPESKKFKDRYIIWVSDPKGGAGKSEFIKWLSIGQKMMNVCKLPIDSVDRLLSAVCMLCKNKTSTKIDVFVIDDTRSKGKDTSFDDMYEAMEIIKNGDVVSTMYGKYSRAIFPRPLFIFFTNRYIQEHISKLSGDRWYPYLIENDELHAINECGVKRTYLKTAKQVHIGLNPLNLEDNLKNIARGEVSASPLEDQDLQNPEIPITIDN